MVMVMVVKGDNGSENGITMTRGARYSDRKKGKQGGRAREEVKEKNKKRERKEEGGDEPRLLTTDLTTGFMRCLEFISPPHLLMLYEDYEIQGRARPYQRKRGGTTE